MNRLINSFYQKPQNTMPVTNMYNEQLSYDKNGNIQTLHRNGDFDSDIYGAIEIDDLSYSYDPDKKNQLVKVTDATNSPKGFKDDSNGTNDSGNDYYYDANGNTIEDDNKKAKEIVYNHLNLPVRIVFENLNKIEYLYDASGQKQRKRVYYGSGYVETDYLDSFQYTDEKLNFFPHAEGYVNVTLCDECEEHQLFNYVYQYKDHLGNIRVSYGLDPADNVLKILEENHYYPFGLKHTHYNSSTKNYEPDPENPEILSIEDLPPGEQLLNKYKYNGKELQDELGLNMYDYGARNYDPAIGRWMNIDPLAEKRYYLTPYNYVQNSPIFRIDPKGLTDFTLNSKTGQVAQVGEVNDDPDRILKTNRKGEIKYNKKGDAKVAIGGIEQGILKDGQNFKNKDQLISIGGKGEPSVKGVKSFTLRLSEYLGKEIKGFSYSSSGSGDVTDMLLGKYANNTLTSSYANPKELVIKYGANYSGNNMVQQFHTHPNGDLGATESAPQISADVRGRQSDISTIPNASFIVLYRMNGQSEPAEFNYTHN